MTAGHGWRRWLASALAAIVLLVGVYLAVVRPRHQRWGATAAEVAAPMAGDDRIAAPNWRVTRAVSIDAPPRDVWPWLVQMGYQRGGLYSYDSLDQWAGILDRPSADTVLPEFQHLKVGDVIPIHNDPGWPVATIDPGRVLVLDITRPRIRITWSFLLTPQEAGGTRLVLRYRGLMEFRLLDLPMAAFLDVSEFIMSRQMLLGIKSRAERLARSAHPG